MSFGFHPFQYGQVSVGTSATLIFAANTATAGVLVVNSGTITVYIGDANVTTANGCPLLASSSITAPSTAAIYGVAASGTTVGFLQVE